MPVQDAAAKLHWEAPMALAGHVRMVMELWNPSAAGLTYSIIGATGALEAPVPEASGVLAAGARLSVQVTNTYDVLRLYLSQAAGLATACQARATGLAS